MAAKMASEYRLQSILSTLDMLDGKKKKKKTRMASLRNPTFSSALKTHDPMSDSKETRLAPNLQYTKSDEKMAGKYSSFLAQIVSEANPKSQRFWRNSPKIETTPVDHMEENFKNSRRRRNTSKIVDDQVETSKRTSNFRVREADGCSSSGARLSKPLEQMPCRLVPTSKLAEIEVNSTSKQEREILQAASNSTGDLTVSGADNTVATLTGASKWQHVVHSRLKLNAIGDLTPSTTGSTLPGVAEMVKTKMKARRNRKPSSDSEKEVENHVMRNHLSTLHVINATIAFKRQRLQRLRENRKFRISRLFKVVARLAVVVRRICEVHFVERGTKETEMSFAQLVSTTQRPDLMFDVTEYKAKRKWQLMSETKRLLQKSVRSEQDNQHIETTLREMSSLGDYPAAMQRSMARVGWYESYGPNRVIVREGHVPDAFYFILSGSALVSVSVPEEPKPKILAILLRGDSFGELAILNQSTRTSTVTSRETVEMFVISAEDFTKIVMSGNTKMLQDPGTVAFMRSVEFLRGWPLKKIESNPKKCVFNFFRKDTVLVQDSKLSEWIYVIKSGSCSVLKQLKYVEPEIFPAKQRRNKDERMTSSRHARLLSARERSFITRRMIAARAQRESLYKRGMDLPYLMMNEELTERIAPTRNRSNTILAGEDGTENIEEEKREERWMEELEERGALTEMKGVMNPLIEVDEDDADDSPRYGPQRTFAHDLNQRALRTKESSRPSSDVSSSARPVFVCIQTLQKGGVFGLADILFSEQPSLSLVSNGAECMVLSKHFFLQHATDDMLHRVKISMMPFAKEDEIQRSLENQLRWEAYRSVTMETTLSRMQMKKFYTK